MAAIDATPINPLSNAGDAANNEPTLLPNPIHPALNVEGSHTIPNTLEPGQPLIVVTFHNTQKLTSSNYRIWKIQLEDILIGYDLEHFIYGSKPLSGLSFLVPGLLARHGIYILANTYARPTCGHKKQLKDQLKDIIKGGSTVTEYMHQIKRVVDELALLGTAMEHEDITYKILDGLNSDYQFVIDVVNGRDSIISFEELHEKLIIKELALHRAAAPTTFPATAHPTQTRPASTFQTRQPSYPRFTNNSSRPAPKPFLGRCQWCNVQGRSCYFSLFYLSWPVPKCSVPPRPTHKQEVKPQAHVAATSSVAPSWLLDSGPSHHVTTDLSNIALHTPYDGTNEVMIGNSSGLPISHTVLHSSTDIDCVLADVPWTFEQCLWVMQRLQPGVDPELVALQQAEFWVQIHSLPVGFQSEMVVSAIEPLKKQMKLKKDNDTSAFIDFRYKRLPSFCFLCGVIGQGDRYCPKVTHHVQDRKVENPFGAWMRAGSRRSTPSSGQRWVALEANTY
nr:Retrovirus-related Pol polyprotein from transposon RE1 [Ipomoea batatas]